MFFTLVVNELSYRVHALSYILCKDLVAMVKKTKYIWRNIKCTTAGHVTYNLCNHLITLIPNMLISFFLRTCLWDFFLCVQEVGADNLSSHWIPVTILQSHNKQIIYFSVSSITQKIMFNSHFCLARLVSVFRMLHRELKLGCGQSDIWQWHIGISASHVHQGWILVNCARFSFWHVLIKISLYDLNSVLLSLSLPWGKLDLLTICRPEDEKLCGCGHTKNMHAADAKELSIPGVTWEYQLHTKTFPTNAFGEIEFVGFGDKVGKVSQIKCLLVYASCIKITILLQGNLDNYHRRLGKQTLTNFQDLSL